MQRTLTVLLCSGLALAPIGASHAQNPQPAPPGVTHPPVAAPNAPTPPPEKMAPTAHDGAGKPSLSKKLAQQNGTLQPPEGVDRGTVIKPRHETGNMPVIPPPGTPGGNQKVVPK